MKGQPSVLGIVLAGGEGKRLWPLTADRAKPAVPFGGNYRLVDFVLSNLVNAGYVRLCVLTQYKSHSLDRHISTTWRLSGVLGDYITPVPAQQRLGPRWYTGSADAIYQSLNLVYDEHPDHIVVFGADHVYRMDPAQMVRQHIESGAGVTVAGIRVPRTEAKAFGCIDSDADGRITSFLEKPADPPHVPDDPEVTFASMGNYVFSTEVLLDALRADAADPDSVHDMGGNIIPMLVDRGVATVYDFSDNEVPGSTERDHGYWRDVGTLDAYYDAHRDLVSVHPVFNLYNQQWPIRTATPPLPPAKFIEGGTARESMVGPGSIISGGDIRGSVVSADVMVDDGAIVEDSVLLPGVRIGRGAVVRRAILDKNVVIAPGARIGVDPARDRESYTVSSGGVVVLGKGARAER
ncbi:MULTISPECIES: glucose-1-phosphate adenylyltransferase [Actinoalloteichus]|uniref:Glucose-1-phosphate adenylyltransferase n=1 Tax=Actinoalloteichus fjordicus TaxID=1612552 RepID=A0AAC9L7U7_9PSEU|nr:MULTISPECIES: glucose-1-phosphate adenylyltransferase [Actinoalloteichus]APU12993.1 glucose-1-phosphate adenylyltransferase [Actinoalloteichus fjordicus]APU18966.1 glucose-1-phosphate adenylyltransferase [Actinoalloteichus sp. GBA129-24]